jgi:sec-independent protein translocase protein TatC
MAFKYLLTFGSEIDKPMITISEYLGFFITTTLLFGAAFEMPLIIVVLAMLGLIDDQFLREKRRVAIMIIAVVSAVITPPDAVSMLAMLLPMILLYEISILIVKYMVKKRQAATERGLTL